MRVTKAGLYVMIKAYGIEGMLSEDESSQIHIDGEKEEATINGLVVLHAFDTIRIQILAVCVEFRRQIKFIFREKINVSKKRTH